MLQIWEPLELIVFEVLPTLGESCGLDYKERVYICFTPTTALFILSWSRDLFRFAHNMDKLE